VKAQGFFCAVVQTIMQGFAFSAAFFVCSMHSSYLNQIIIKIVQSVAKIEKFLLWLLKQPQVY
tara:strand:+ start:41 stop:229 length:189 start_codon:yes stop_codon:yes gene_type:complete